ncbi:ABC transporter ATP-binding protein [Prochlorococcus sp. MIT 1341]|uniref:ABC transporter ATP-binding protein n=1 Tax=Prochlorococcus sp. MIT 1341 TaxID=3096221 RepID=UPI002A762716|nr:ABC transporter ATP-binding protein [Prochlorococcus sp. MIT 1341]
MTLHLNNVGEKLNNKWILRNVCLSVNDGEIMALLGPSGCGKSSTLRVIAGLDKPNEGDIYIDNKNVTMEPPVNRGVAMVFQSYALFPHLSVKENLSLGLRIRGISRKQIQTRVSTMLSIMKLEEHVEQLPSKLSGGQRQRVALARALLRDPSVYLLDEPMSNLDAQLREDLRPELRSLMQNRNKPVVYVTHDQHEAMALANRISILNNGSIEQTGTPKEIYTKPSTLFVASFIGSPKINTINSTNNIVSAIRPEDIFFSKTGIPCKIIANEWHGKNQILLLKSPKGIIRMLCEKDESIPENIQITWDKDKEHHFDISTGKSVEQ